MTNEQLRRAKEIKERIVRLTELEYLLKLKHQPNVFIELEFSDAKKVEIPEHSKEVILALCIKEREKLEKEFENL